MDNKIDPCDTMRNNLIAAALGLQQCTKTAANIVPLPGTERFITIGTPEEVRGLLPDAALASQSQAAQPTELAEKLRNHHAREIWDWDLLLDAAETIERLACQSQATKAQAEPVAYLRYWARQSWSGNGNHDIDHGEGLEVCAAGEVGDDGKPAFPVYADPVAKEAPAVLEGWKLVPVEPTPEMLEESRGSLPVGARHHGLNVYRAMLVTAPVASVAKEATRDAETGSVQVKTWQERRQNGSNFERAMLDEIADLRRVLGNIVANAEVQADARMGGKTDCYAVPLDDVEAARKAIPEPRAEAIQIEGEPDESFYRRIVFNTGWNACLKEFRATTTSTVSAPDEIRNQAADTDFAKLMNDYRYCRQDHAGIAYSFVKAYVDQSKARAVDAALERAARRVEADCLGFADDDKSLNAIARDIRALRTSSTDQANADTGSAE